MIVNQQFAADATALRVCGMSLNVMSDSYCGIFTVRKSSGNDRKWPYSVLHKALHIQR